MLRKWGQRLLHLTETAEAAGVDTPRCLQSMNDLREAFTDEFGIVSNRRGKWSRYRGGKRRRRVQHLPVKKQLEIYKQRYQRACSKNNQLRKQLAKHTDSKTLGGRVTEDWICRVIACAPHVSARALQETLHLATGADATAASRFSVRGIRAAWLEMYREIVFSRCRENIANARTATQRGGGANASHKRRGPHVHWATGGSSYASHRRRARCTRGTCTNQIPQRCVDPSSFRGRRPSPRAGRGGNAATVN